MIGGGTTGLYDLNVPGAGLGGLAEGLVGLGGFAGAVNADVGREYLVGEGGLVGLGGLVVRVEELGVGRGGFSGLGLLVRREPTTESPALTKSKEEEGPRSMDICFVPLGPTRAAGVGRGLPAFVGEPGVGMVTGLVLVLVLVGCVKDDAIEDDLDMELGGVFNTAGRVGLEGVGACTGIGV